MAVAAGQEAAEGGASGVTCDATYGSDLGHQLVLQKNHAVQVRACVNGLVSPVDQSQKLVAQVLPPVFHVENNAWGF